MDVRLPDGTIIRNVPEGTTKAQIMAKLGRSAMPQERPADPMEGIGTGQRVLEGVGQGMSNLWLGAKQRLGMASQGEVDEAKRVDAPLLNTTGGAVGSAIGSVVGATPTLIIPGANTIGGAAAAGGIIGALQPTGKDESVLGNTATGAALGGVGQYGLGKLAQFAGNKLASAEAAGALKKSQNAVRDATLKASQDAGYTIPPSMAGGSLPSRMAEGISGKIKTGQAAAVKNQTVTERLARQALGLSADAPITTDTMKQIRNEAFKRGYEPVSGAGRIETDGAYKAALDNIVAKYRGAAADFPGAADDSVTKFIDGSGKAGEAARSAWVDDAGRVLNDVSAPKEPQMRSLLDEVKKAGGISTKEVNDLGIFGIQKSHPGLLRKQSGNDADSLLEIMREHGWINQAQMDAAEHSTGGAQEYAKDMLRSALSGERIVHPSQQEAWYAFSDAMQDMADRGIKKVTLPGTESQLQGGLRIKDFDAGNGIKMISILREEASGAFHAGNKPLGKAKRDAAEALEEQIERGLAKRGKDGAGALKEFREARKLMAKSHSVEQALIEGGGTVNAKVLGRAFQKGKPLSGELRTIGAFANNFGDVAGMPKSGWSNPITALDAFGVAGMAGFGAGPMSVALPAARLAARQAILSGKTTPQYGPGLLQKIPAKTLKELERLGAGGLLANFVE